MPTGHPSTPEHAGTLSAGKPAKDAGTVRTSWTYASRPELELSIDDESGDERERRGAVRIAEGWSRTSIFGFEVCEEDDDVEWFVRTLGARKMWSKSSRTSLRTRWACKK